MPENTYHPNGQLHEAYDDSGRIYTRYDEEGVLVEQRPYTTEESSSLDQLEQNRQLLTEQAHQHIATLLSSIDTLKAISDKTNATIGPKDTKDVAREVTRVARALVRVTRLVVGALDSVGPADA